VLDPVVVVCRRDTGFYPKLIRSRCAERRTATKQTWRGTEIRDDNTVRHERGARCTLSTFIRIDGWVILGRGYLCFENSTHAETERLRTQISMQDPCTVLLYTVLVARRVVHGLHDRTGSHKIFIPQRASHRVVCCFFVFVRFKPFHSGHYCAKPYIIRSAAVERHFDENFSRHNYSVEKLPQLQYHNSLKRGRGIEREEYLAVSLCRLDQTFTTLLEH